MTRVIYLREQPRPVKHVSFDYSGSTLAVSCTDGIVYIYSLSSEEPQLVKRLDGLIKIMETDSRMSSRIIWHPDGRAFAAPTPTKGKENYTAHHLSAANRFSAIQVVSRKDWTNQRAFNSNQKGDFTAAAWSPNGALLATAGDDLNLTLWNTQTQQALLK